MKTRNIYMPHDGVNIVPGKQVYYNRETSLVTGDINQTKWKTAYFGEISEDRVKIFYRQSLILDQPAVLESVENVDEADLAEVNIYTVEDLDEISIDETVLDEVESLYNEWGDKYSHENLFQPGEIEEYKRQVPRSFDGLENL